MTSTREMSEEEKAELLMEMRKELIDWDAFRYGHHDKEEAFSRTCCTTLRNRVYTEKNPRAYIRQVFCSRLKDITRENLRHHSCSIDAVVDPGERGYTFASEEGNNLASAIPQSKEQSPEDALISQEGIGCLMKMLPTLAPEHGILITMFYLEGKRYCDIAREIGIPEGTVKSRMHSAKRLLRKSMGVLAA